MCMRLANERCELPFQPAYRSMIVLYLQLQCEIKTDEYRLDESKEKRKFGGLEVQKAKGAEKAERQSEKKMHAKPKVPYTMYYM